MAAQTFHYAARGRDGELVRGSMEAVDARQVLDLLRSRALVVTAVNPQTDIAASIGRALRAGRASHGARVAFFRAFATLIRAGVSIQRALTVTIERTTDARLRETLRAVLADVEAGQPLSAALGRRPHDVPALYVAMIAAGEAGGILDDVLERLALLLEREAALRKNIQAATAYPLVVLSAAALLVMFLIVKVVPMFAVLFDSFHVELPLGTRVLVALGASLNAPLPWLTALVTFPAAAFALRQAARTSAGALAFDRLRLQLPVFGALARKAITARAVRMLATLLRSGIELSAAIDAVVDVCGSPCYAQAFARVNLALRDGEPLAGPLAQSRLFDPLVPAFVRVGEETGALDEMLVKLAEYFETDVDAAIATLGSVIEPLLIVGLGAIVGCLVLSIFIPLYSLIGNVSK